MKRHTSLPFFGVRACHHKRRCNLNCKQKGGGGLVVVVVYTSLSSRASHSVGPLG